MPENSWLDAVPIGLLMFAGTLFGLLRRQWGKRASRVGFPELGRRLGLRHTAADTPGAAGVLSGQVDGYIVRVESEVRPRLVLRLPYQLGLDLRNYDRWKRLPPQYAPFAFSDPLLNQWLRTRLVHRGMDQAFTRDEALQVALRAFRSNRAVREFNVADGRIECTYDYGTRALFPAQAAEAALKQGLHLAQALASCAVVPDAVLSGA